MEGNIRARWGLDLAAKLRFAGLMLAVVYPLWALSALLVLLFDRFVIRRAGRLRTAFGIRSP